MISGTCGERQACYLEHAVIWLPHWHTGHKYLGSWHQTLPVGSTAHSVSGPLKEDPRRNLRFPWECLPWEGKLQHSQRRKGNNTIRCYAPLRCQELSYRDSHAHNTSQGYVTGQQMHSPMWQALDSNPIWSCYKSQRSSLEKLSPEQEVCLQCGPPSITQLL